MTRNTRRKATQSGPKPGASAAAGSVLNPGDEALPGTPGTGEDICPHCHGSGRLAERKCPDCAGTGRIVVGIGGA